MLLTSSNNNPNLSCSKLVVLHVLHFSKGRATRKSVDFLKDSPPREPFDLMDELSVCSPSLFMQQDLCCKNLIFSNFLQQDHCWKISSCLIYCNKSHVAKPFFSNFMQEDTCCKQCNSISLAYIFV